MDIKRKKRSLLEATLTRGRQRAIDNALAAGRARPAARAPDVRDAAREERRDRIVRALSLAKRGETGKKEQRADTLRRRHHASRESLTLAKLNANMPTTSRDRAFPYPAYNKEGFLGEVASKVKFSKTPTLGTFRSGMAAEATPGQASMQPLSKRKTNAEGKPLKRSPSAWMKAKRTSVTAGAVTANVKSSENLMRIIGMKPVGTTFEIYGTKRGKEYVIKVKKQRSAGETLFVMTGNREVEIQSSGAGLQVLDKRTQRQIMSNGDDMIWESADLVDVGRIFIGEGKSKKKSWLEIIRAAQAAAKPEAFIPAPKATAKKKSA